MSQSVTPSIYRIEVGGWLDPMWSDWFEGMTIASNRDTGAGPVTVLTGPVQDQAALQGILTRLWNLNLSLLTVIRIPDPQAEC